MQQFKQPTRFARLGAVTRVTEVPEGLLVPVQVANKTQTQLDYLLFVLKSEGVNVQVLAQAMPRELCNCFSK